MRIAVLISLLLLVGCNGEIQYDVIKQCEAACNTNDGVHYMLWLDDVHAACVCNNGAKFNNLTHHVR